MGEKIRLCDGERGGTALGELDAALSCPRKSVSSDKPSWSAYFGFWAVVRMRWLVQLSLFGLRAWLSVWFLLALAACAGGVVNHAFSFDVKESPGIQVLDYQYGNSLQPGIRADKLRPWPNGYPSTGTSGEMLRGDFLYVKWRVVTSGKIYVSTVNLRNLLPRNIERHEIRFVVQAQQIIVYLISPERRAEDEPPNGPPMYRHLQVITIFSGLGQEAANP